MASYESVQLEEEARSKRVQLQEEEEPAGAGCCFYVLAFFSFLLIIVFFPFSLIWSVKIVKEYERAVILRLGRLTSRKAKGPGNCAVTRYVAPGHVQ